MSGYSDYLAEVSAGFQEGAGDVARNAAADIGDTYQTVFLQGRSFYPHTPMTGDMLTSGPQAEPAPQSFDAALRDHQAMAEAEQQQPWPGASDNDAPDNSAPDSSAPEIDIE